MIFFLISCSFLWKTCVLLYKDFCMTIYSQLLLGSFLHILILVLFIYLFFTHFWNTQSPYLKISTELFIHLSSCCHFLFLSPQCGCWRTYSHHHEDHYSWPLQPPHTHTFTSQCHRKGHRKCLEIGHYCHAKYPPAWQWFTKYRWFS